MPALKAHPRVMLTPMTDGTGVLLNLDTKMYYTLNATGVAVWKRLAAAPPPNDDDLVGVLTAAFDVDDATARADLGAMLQPLIDEGVIVRA